MQWQPELSVKLSEALVWGATIRQACHGAATAKATELRDPCELADLVRAGHRIVVVDAKTDVDLTQSVKLASDVSSF